ncbi:hypothetical protein SL1157_1121 [Ruegeria lacuscaerulensis ITI-1157]|nr:hypothetical protein SL1157_1121 [Ruegeria lacuscaerulensis ITI-1157]
MTFYDIFAPCKAIYLNGVIQTRVFRVQSSPFSASRPKT